jgi:hypothetical protein
MCISIFAIQKAIKVEYASESVWLDKDGLMEIVVDLLITSKDNTAISELYCIIPQKLFYPSINKPPSKYKGKKLYQDITEDIVSTNSKFNKPHKEKTFLIKPNPNNPGETIVELELSNPNFASKDMVYKGYYYGGNEIIPCKGIDDIGQTILTENKLSVFNIILREPLKKDTARWFRWRFFTLTGALELRDGFDHFYHSILMDKLFYNYSVNGPGKVFKSLKHQLDSFGKSIRIYSDTKKIEAGKIYDSFKDIYKKLVEDGTENPLTIVSINDWRTRFYNIKLEPFSSIQTEGEIRTSGSQPNIISENIYYEWKSGKINIANAQDSGYFTIRFLTKYESRFRKILPYIALIISISSLIIGFLRK